MTSARPALWTEAIPTTGTGTLFADPDGFVGMVLEFNYHAKHPASGVLLREFLAEIPGCAWSKAQRAWIVSDITDIPRGLLKAAGITVVHSDGSPARPSDLGQFVLPTFEPAKLLDDVPEWFGVDLYPYQREGALSIALGRRLLADEPGVGKTFTSLAAASVLQSKRTLVLCPPVVLTHWERSVTTTGLAHSVGGAVVVVSAGRKMPDLPDTGVVIASSSLVSGRAEFARQLGEWQPTVFILDEAHSVKTWSSRRSRVLRRLSRSCAVSIPTTGTPVLSSPLELAAQLDIAGVLNPLFGSYIEFRSRYTKRTKWGYAPIKSRLPELRQILDDAVWVRRTKAQVLPDLPAKIRAPLWVDVDMGEYKAALVEVNERIDEWLDKFKSEFKRLPSNDRHSEYGDEVFEWCSGRGDLAARLRRAAGLSKVPAAVDWITEHLLAHPSDHGVWPSPLIVWAHHHEVTARLMAGLSAFAPRLIDGTTSQGRRDQFADEFQSGRVAVLVGSIQAAGVGITLTRASEALFVEMDWTPAMVLQSEDRIHRIGQDAQQVCYTNLIAANTLDERIHDVLFAKGGVLTALMDGDHAVVQKVSERLLSSQILADMVAERIKRRRKC